MDTSVSFIDSYQPCDPSLEHMFGYPMQNSVDSAMRDNMQHHSDIIPICDHPGLSERTWQPSDTLPPSSDATSQYVTNKSKRGELVYKIFYNQLHVNAMNFITLLKSHFGTSL